jgi:hypothetical protein
MILKCYYCNASKPLLSWYCEDCSDLRRILLIQKDTKKFIDKIRNIFLVNHDIEIIKENEPKKKDVEKNIDLNREKYPKIVN